MLTKQTKYTSKGLRFLHIQSTRYPDAPMLGWEYELAAPNKFRPLLPRHYIAQWESFSSTKSGWEIKSPVAPLFWHKLSYHGIKHYIPWHYSASCHNAGIHVNISKEGQPDAKGHLVFHYLHEVEGKEWLIQLSGRTRASFNNNAYQVKGVHPAWFLGPYSDYCSILTDRKQYAFEFRLFTAQPHLLLPALEMADSLFTLAPQVEQISRESWLNYIKDKSKYQHINQHIKETFA